MALIARTLPGAVITETADGQEALRAFRQNGGTDVLISNNHMPRLDGPGLVRQLRRGGGTLPIISVSADPAAAGAALDAGAHWFVGKDALAEELPGLLRRALALALGEGASDAGGPGPPAA